MIQKLFFTLLILAMIGCASADMSPPSNQTITNYECSTTCLA